MYSTIGLTEKIKDTIRKNSGKLRAGDIEEIILGGNCCYGSEDLRGDLVHMLLNDPQIEMLPNGCIVYISQPQA